MEKLCVFCNHCMWEAPYSYSEYTSGGGYLTCGKGHPMHWSDYDGLQDMRAQILKAQTCPDYDQAAMDKP